MSRNYKSSKEVPTSVLCSRLHELSEIVSKPLIRDSELTMRIPAEVDRDADLVISEAARRLEQQAAELSSIAQAIHYPECWDTVNYPTLLDAVKEIGCNPADCTHNAQG